MAKKREVKRIEHEDVALALHNVPNETLDLMHAVQLICVEIAEVRPGESKSVTNLAARTGLSQARVAEILAKPDYRDIFRAGLLDRVTSKLQRAVDVLDGIIQDPDGKTTDKINASKTMAGIYGTVNSSIEPHRGDVGELAFREIMDRILTRKASVNQKLNRITVESKT